MKLTEAEIFKNRDISDGFYAIVNTFFSTNKTAAITPDQVHRIETVLSIYDKATIDGIMPLVYRYKARQLGSKCLCDCHFFRGFFHCFSGDCCYEPNNHHG